MGVEEPRGVELGEAKRGPALRVLEALSRVYHVEDEVEVGRMNKILLHPDKRYQVVVSQKDSEHNILDFACIPTYIILLFLCKFDQIYNKPDYGLRYEFSR